MPFRIIVAILVLGAGETGLKAQGMADGRYVADTISHNDFFFFPFSGHEPAENCIFLQVEHAPGTDWGRWTFRSWGFEAGTDILAYSPDAGIFSMQADTVRFDGWVDRRVAIRGDTLEFEGEGHDGERMYSRWYRVGDPNPLTFEDALMRTIVYPWNCQR